MQLSLTLVSAVNNREVLEKNLLSSPCLLGPHSHQILIQEGYSSASKAYNDAIDNSKNDLIVFVHQDILLPGRWFQDLEKALASLEASDPSWGALGCYGETLNDQGRGYIYSNGRGVLGKPFEHPEPINTLDEIVLILRKSSGLRFDDDLPGFHMYGADICMIAKERGMRSYAISAFCIHNTVFNLVLPKEFYDCYEHIQRTRRASLPIQTTCVRITRFGMPMYKRRLQEFYLTYIRNRRVAANREPEPRNLLDAVCGKS